MKHLVQYINEGLFNVDKNISDTHEVEKILFNDHNSDWWKYCVPFIGNLPANNWNFELTKAEIDIDKDIISIPNGIITIGSSPGHPNPFTNKYTLNCGNFVIGQPHSNGPHPDPIADGGGFKEINCNSVIIDGYCEKLSGFKFNITPQNRNMSGIATINWASQLDYFDADFNFIGNSTSVFALRSVYSWPNLENVKSNADTISLYDSSLFDWTDIKAGLDKFFGKGTVTANGIVKNKSARNIVAIVNNIKKYGAIIPTEVIPEGKLSDLLDLRGFKNLKKVTLRNNNVHIVFVKPDDKRMIERHAKFVRLNNMKLYKDAKLDEMVDLVMKCQTKDGWVVILEPEQFG
jgi:hypothetical protein